MGGSGKAKIVTAKSKPGLAVPKEAVFEEDGTSYVLAIDGSDEGTKVLKKVAVTVGKGNDFETTVESKDLKAQDLVIKAPDLYKNYEGVSVSVDKR
ncbi:HlyD family secretion protein [Corynebacterium diphtheriae 241]|nr:HlyD family secretion protein [Corynebacterium diphtheriae 241]